jgi:hypothetical protein
LDTTIMVMAATRIVAAHIHMAIRTTMVIRTATRTATAGLMQTRTVIPMPREIQVRSHADTTLPTFPCHRRR